MAIDLPQYWIDNVAYDLEFDVAARYGVHM